jgi:thioredoxin 1
MDTQQEHSGIVTVNDGNFESVVLKAQGPILVDFWAPWCGPCRSVAPLLEQLAEKYKGKLTIAKMNVDENTTAGRFGIRSIPTLFLFKNGTVVASLVGAVPMSELEKFVGKWLG